MSTVSFNSLSSQWGYAQAVDSQTVYATGSTFTWTYPTVSMQWGDNNPYTGAGTMQAQYFWVELGSYSTTITTNTTASTSEGVWSNYVGFTTASLTRNTSTHFSSSNPTERTVTGRIYARTSATAIVRTLGTGASYAYTASDQTLTTVSITLDAPPTFTVGSMYYDTNEVYANLTTANVDVSSVSAKYGGTITEVKLTIGNQTATLTGNGTLSIPLDAGGTFTPTVTVTDSRGQTATQTLDPITVNVYTPPSVSFNVDRTLNTGVPDDEGEYATIDVTLTFADMIATVQSPLVSVKDDLGVTSTPTVAWYSTRASNGALSGSITSSDWDNFSTGTTVYALLTRTGGFNTQKSYQISLTPRDSESNGTVITQTLETAFYTVDFLAGGHGIAFGQPASQTGFHCNMDAYFNDMSAQEIDDFVNSIGGGGESVPSVHIVKKSLSATAQAGKSSWVVDISDVVPSGATVQAVIITKLPNPNWIYANIYLYSSTSVTVAYNNTYSASITEPLELGVLYTFE